MFRIIPQPVHMKTDASRTGFVLRGDATITAFPFAADLIDFVRRVFNIEMKAGNGDCSVTLLLDDSIAHSEGYALRCEGGRILITARTESGLFYGVQTLKQMLLQTGGNIPCAEIEDHPRFAFRGYMLDSGRYFYPVEDVKRIADFMALHKLNVLHWHLTEDQGWRVEIKKYPLLTEKGSRRRRTNFNHRPHGGFYTQEQIREVVDYCHARMIKVVPEFDVPGHNVAAIACYPHLSCFDRKLEVATHWGVKSDILCAGKESTYEFVYNVLDELIELFPDKIIHIGGDEAHKARWKVCPHCQKAIRENGLRDENDLQMLFMTRVDRYLQSKGCSSMMWNNDTKGGTEFLSPDIAWTVYKPNAGRDSVETELERGRKLVNTVNRRYYFNFPYGWVSLADVCSDDGAFAETDDGTWGIEACMWTEYVPGMKTLEFLTFPRLGAMAENAWAEKGYPNFETFMGKAKDYLKLLDVYKIRYAPMRKACPSFLYRHASSLWFKRRRFHWESRRIRKEDERIAQEARRAQGEHRNARQ